MRPPSPARLLLRVSPKRRRQVAMVVFDTSLYLLVATAFVPTRWLLLLVAYLSVIALTLEAFNGVAATDVREKQDAGD